MGTSHRGRGWRVGLALGALWLALSGEVGAQEVCRARLGDYCAPDRCGPCGEGQGDCDPGQCLPGLVCVEEGATDRCRPAESCTPGAGDYCAPDQCGPCGEGDGDCDPGQVCVEEGATDRCRAVGPGSNFQVQLDGVWRGVCCDGRVPEVSDRDCLWTESDRTLTDQTAGLKLDCPEGPPTACVCNGSGERMHGRDGSDVDTSLSRPDGGPIFPDFLVDTCVVVDADGTLVTEWTDGSCPSFRLE